MKRTLLSIAVISCSFLNSQINLNSSLTACYALNGNANEAVNALNGTLAGATPTVDRFNNASSALYFSGSPSSYVSFPNSPSLKPANVVTISGWYRPASLLNSMTVVFTKNIWTQYFTAYSLTIQNHGSGWKFRAYRQNGSGDNFVDCTTIVTVGTWYHVVFSIDNTNMSIYVNGVLEGSVPVSITNFNYDSTRDVIIGGENELNHNDVYRGSIDNMRFYNRLLNAAEVNALYTQDPACLANGLPPVAQFTTSATNVCVGGTVTLTDQSTNNPTAWSWTVSGGATGNPTLSTTVYSFNSPGTYTASLTSANNSGSSLNTPSQTIVVHANPTVTAAPSKTLYCPGEKVTLTASGASSYTWSNLQSSSIYTTIGVANANITLTVTGTNSVGCMATTTVSYKVTDKCTGLNENGFLDHISIFPNPNNGLLHLNTGGCRLVHVSVVHMTGQSVREIQCKGNEENLVLDIEDLPSGIYFIEIKSDSGSKVERIIKE